MTIRAVARVPRSELGGSESYDDRIDPVGAVVDYVAHAFRAY